MVPKNTPLPPQAAFAMDTHSNSPHRTNISSDPSYRDPVMRRGPLVSIIIPTLNDHDNIDDLLSQLRTVMHDIEWEVIFVDDDSADGTASVVRRIGSDDARVRCVHRIGRRGLSGACVEGMLTSSASYLVVMGADFQHNPAVVRRMFSALHTRQAELVIASRDVKGGSYEDVPNIQSHLRQFDARLDRLFLRDNLTDWTSNFFALHRELFEEVSHGLSQLGFKLLLDILLTARRNVRIVEVPIALGTPTASNANFESYFTWDYLMLLVDKKLGHYIPVRFLAFSAIGAFGAGINLTALAILYQIVGTSFMISESLSTAISIVCNYTLNNMLTFRDHRRRGIKWLTGLVSFAAACSVGVAANIGLAFYLFTRQLHWFISALAGILVGVVWNYTVTGFYTWRRNG